MDAELEVERFEGIRVVGGIEWLERGGDIEVASRPPTGRGAEVSLIEMTEVVPKANSPERHGVIRAARTQRWTDSSIDID